MSPLTSRASRSGRTVSSRRSSKMFSPACRPTLIRPAAEASIRRLKRHKGNLRRALPRSHRTLPDRNRRSSIPGESIVKGIDPIWLTVITTVVAIDNWIGGGKVDLHHVFPDAWIPWIVGWTGFLGGILGFVVAGLTTIISNKPGILIGTPPAAAKPIVIIALVLGSLFALPGSAHAQTKLRPLTGDVAKDLGLKPAGAAGTSNAATATDQAMGSFGAEVRKITKELVDK